MRTITLEIDDSLYTFYQKISKQSDGRPTEKVMADVLLRYAGDVSLKAIRQSRPEGGIQ